MSENEELEVGATPHAEDEVTEDELALINKTADEVMAEEQQAKQEPEPEPEPEEEPEAKAEPEPEEEKKESVMIPKARLDQEIRNRRSIENELTGYKEKELNYHKEKERNESLQNELDEKKKEKDRYVEELETAFINGDMRKIAEMFDHRDKVIRDETINEIQRGMPAEIERKMERDEFEQAKDSIEEAFSFLRPGTDDFDTGLVETILSFTEAEVRKGKTPAVALKDATSKVLLYEKPADVEKFLISQGLRKPTEATGKQDTGRLEAKINASNNQPPEMQSSVSQDVVIPDFADMSEDEFDKLSEKEIKSYMNKMEGR